MISLLPIVCQISLGEELTYDYRYSFVPGQGFSCHCGASTCRGSLNWTQYNFRTCLTARLAKFSGSYCHRKQGLKTRGSKEYDITYSLCPKKLRRGKSLVICIHACLAKAAIFAPQYNCVPSFSVLWTWLGLIHNFRRSWYVRV